MKKVLREFSEALSEKLECINILRHDMKASDETPVQQNPYRTSPAKDKIIRDEDAIVNCRLQIIPLLCQNN